METRDADEFLNWLNGPYGGSSTDRPWNVVNWSSHLADSDGPAFWRVVIEEWSGFDAIPHDEFAKLFVRFASSRPPIDCPATLTIYRGQDGAAPNGLSWTTDRATAEEFAQGHRWVRHKRPTVLQLEVPRDQVAFLCDDREESEVVLKDIPSMAG